MLNNTIVTDITSAQDKLLTFKAFIKDVIVPSWLTKKFLIKTATLWPILNPEHCFTRTASTIASILSKGVPKMNLQGRK